MSAKTNELLHQFLDNTPSFEDIEKQIIEVSEAEEVEVVEAEDLVTATQAVADAKEEVAVAQEAFQSVLELGSTVERLKTAVSNAQPQEGEMAETSLAIAKEMIAVALDQYGLTAQTASMESIDKAEDLQVSLEGVIGDFFGAVGRSIKRVSASLLKFFGATFTAVKMLRAEADRVIADAQALPAKSEKETLKLPGSAKLVFPEKHSKFSDATRALNSQIAFTADLADTFTRELESYQSAVKTGLQEYNKLFEEYGKTKGEIITDYANVGNLAGFLLGYGLFMSFTLAGGAFTLIGVLAVFLGIPLAGAGIGALIGMIPATFKGKSSDDPAIQARVKKCQQIHDGLHQKFLKLDKALSAKAQSGKDLSGGRQYEFGEGGLSGSKVVTKATSVPMPTKGEIAALAKAAQGTGQFERKYASLVQAARSGNAALYSEGGEQHRFWSSYGSPLIAVYSLKDAIEDSVRSATAALTVARAAIKQY